MNRHLNYDKSLMKVIQLAGSISKLNDIKNISYIYIRCLYISVCFLYNIYIFADVCNADLNPYTPQCISSVLKKFLRELPDPVVPVQWYDRFLEAASE